MTTHPPPLPVLKSSSTLGSSVAAHNKFNEAKKTKKPKKLNSDRRQDREVHDSRLKRSLSKSSNKTYRQVEHACNSFNSASFLGSGSCLDAPETSSTIEKFWK